MAFSLVPFSQGWRGARKQTGPASPGLIVSALAGTTSYLFYYKGIDAIGPAKAMALNISYSAWAVVFGTFMGAIPGPLEIACCIVIICSTVLSATPDWKAMLSSAH